MERSCSIFEIRRSNILFWRTSRLRGNLSFEEIPCIFEEPCYLRTTSSKKASLSSLCGFEHREISMFDLRSGITKNSLSPTSDLRSRRSKNPHLRSSEPKNRSKIERKTGERERERRLLRKGGENSLKMEFFDLPGPKDQESLFDLQGRKNQEPLPFFHLVDQKNEYYLLHVYFFFRTPWPMATSFSQLCWGLDLQPDVPPWRSVRSSSAFYILLPSRPAKIGSWGPRVLKDIFSSMACLKSVH